MARNSTYGCSVGSSSTSALPVLPIRAVRPQRCTKLLRQKHRITLVQVTPNNACTRHTKQRLHRSHQTTPVHVIPTLKSVAAETLLQAYLVTLQSVHVLTTPQARSYTPQAGSYTPCRRRRVILHDPVDIWNIHATPHDVSAHQNTSVNVKSTIY